MFVAAWEIWEEEGKNAEGATECRLGLDDDNDAGVAGEKRVCAAPTVKVKT